MLLELHAQLTVGGVQAAHGVPHHAHLMLLHSVLVQQRFMLLLKLLQREKMFKFNADYVSQVMCIGPNKGGYSRSPN